MDFFDRQARARKQTRRLILLFGLAVLVVLILNYLILAALVQPFLKYGSQISSLYAFINDFLVTALLQLGDAFAHPFIFLKWLWNPYLAGGIALGTLISIASGCYYKFRQLSSGGPAVAALLGGRCLDSSPSNLNEQRLRGVIGEMAVASGLPVPEIYVLDNERGVNSFAAGHTHDDVAIGITRGGLVLLTRDELQGVIAHEFSHILNGDTRLNMRLMALAHGLFWPTIFGRTLLREAAQSIESDDSILEEAGAAIRLPFIPMACLFLLMGLPALPLVRLIKSAICREREWLADAAAVQFTRNPAGIAGALKKIGGLYKSGRLDSPYAETASHLYFANSAFDSLFNFQSTHPPLAKRVLAIDPAFDGQFQHINALPRPTDEIPQDVKYDRLYEESVRRAREEAKARGELK
ncbi:MAG: M48 family metalloprotease [Verrucomicrobiia bacterium]